MLKPKGYQNTSRLVTHIMPCCAAQTATHVQGMHRAHGDQSFLSGMTSFRVPSFVMIRISTASPCQPMAQLHCHHL